VPTSHTLPPVSPAPNPTAPNPTAEPAPARAELQLAWSPSGAVARCAQHGKVRLTYLAADGEQQPVPVDYPDAGLDPVAIGQPRWQPNGERVAIPHDRGVMLWDARARKTVATVAVRGGSDAPAVTWNAGGTHFATFVAVSLREIHDARTPIQIWAADGARQHVLTPRNGDVSATMAVSLHPNGSAISSGAGAPFTWGQPIVGDQVAISSLSRGGATTRHAPGHTALYDPTGRRIAVAAGSDQLDGQPATTTLYDASSLRAQASVPGRFAQWSRDGERIVTQTTNEIVLSSTDGQVVLRVPTAERLGFSRQSDLSPDGKQLAVETPGGTVVWDVHTKNKVANLVDLTLPLFVGAEVVAARDASQNTVLASVTSERRITITARLDNDVCHVALGTEDDGDPQASWRAMFGQGDVPHAGPSTAPASRGSSSTTPTAPSGSVLQHMPKAEGATPLMLAWAPDDRTFVARCHDGTRALVDLKRLGSIATLPHSAEHRAMVSWNEASTHFVVRSAGHAELWKRSTATRQFQQPIDDDTPAHVAWSPPASQRVAVSWFAGAKVGARVAILDLATGRSVTTLKPPPSDYEALVSWRPDGRQLATRPNASLMQMEFPSRIDVWDAQSGQSLSSFTPKSPGRVQATYWLLWHPTDPVIYTGSGDGILFMLSYFTGDRVQLWDANSGRTLGALPGRSADIDPSRRLLAVTDGHHWRAPRAPTTTLYDLRTQKPVTKVTGSVASFDHKGRWIITTVAPSSSSNMPSAGRVVYRLWSLPGGDPVGRLALGSFDGERPVDHIGGDRFVEWTRPWFLPSKEPLSFRVWDLTHSVRRSEHVFDRPATVTSRRWFDHGRVLALGYEDGRHRFIAIDTGRFVDLTANPHDQRCGVDASDASGKVTLAALGQLLAPPP
jgi:WD40 repeat protein